MRQWLLPPAPFSVQVLAGAPRTLATSSVATRARRLLLTPFMRRLPHHATRVQLSAPALAQPGIASQAAWSWKRISTGLPVW